MVTPSIGSPFEVLGTRTTTVVQGLTDGKSMTFTVAGANGSGVGPQSAPTTPITIGAPGAPSAAAAARILRGGAQGVVRGAPEQRVGDHDVQGSVSVVGRRRHAGADRQGESARRQEPHEGQDVYLPRDRVEQPRQQPALATVASGYPLTPRGARGAA